MSHDTITRPRVEPEKKLQPPARWRNWWRALDGYYFIDSPNPSPGIRCWPSKQIAETAAAELIEAMTLKGVWPRGKVVWEGAFREGERP